MSKKMRKYVYLLSKQESNSKKVSNFSESVVNQSDLFRVSVIPSVTKCNTRKCNTQKRETLQVTHGNKTNVIDLG